MREDRRRGGLSDRSPRRRSRDGRGGSSRDRSSPCPRRPGRDRRSPSDRSRSMRWRRNRAKEDVNDASRAGEEHTPRRNRSLSGERDGSRRVAAKEHVRDDRVVHTPRDSTFRESGGKSHAEGGHYTPRGTWRGQGPPPRPGYDEDRRLQQLADDPRYFEGAELGKAQRAALGQSGLAGRNTASFYPKSTLVRPAMRVFYGSPEQKQCEERLRQDDVLVVPDFICQESDFSFHKAVMEEIARSAFNEERSLDDFPICKKAVRKACKYAGIDHDECVVRVTFRGPEAATPVVYDFGKTDGRPSADENCAVTISFGSEWESAFRRSGSSELLFFPYTNGCLTLLGLDVWLRWMIGENTYPRSDQGNRGHVCVTILGRTSLVKTDKLLDKSPSDAKLGFEALRGSLGVVCHDKPRPEMRVITVPKRERYGRTVRHDDVIIVPELFCAEDDWSTYYKLIEEMRESQSKGERRAEWISWHEGAHLLSQNPTGSQTYQKVLDKMCDYFSVAEGDRGTRFNWYRDGSDWKPFHHDSAAFNPQRAANQNCTIGISFGASRELAFRHAKTGELIYFPQKNGMLFYFGRDANIVWQHGINALPEQEQDGKGRISIILWGYCKLAIDEQGSPPMLTDDARGQKGKGKGKGGDWGYDGRRNQPCRDFAKGRCTYGASCRFSHESNAGR